ncbi:uncharacterized protein LACBIDRAFT_335574 [Laccaria bicolor S238N-H82]|uniref:Predicted protein n=1 Tax=Laccaria bicolor (strain S238N-H82 / ATCC MYA-4686) TaxID=486041 RepID=B0E2P7_LACBS|nr:uncharacterized protein LACBIDRAFT_335574 [Laccaria bicolor S238N-H82]EDQ98881.1 predicted protein [Laccaria bicolor S238N-H82]|eukprot:XP_001890460.1 predicted protein [Laccaria bicolor S238N-H82]
MDIAVIHRLEFALAIRVSNINIFIPDVVSGLDQMGIKALYQPGFTEPSFSYTKGTPAIFANAYLAKINDILFTRHLLGKSDSHEENPIGLQWDQVSAQEGSFLFGFVPSQDSLTPERYLFPPPHYLWELCDHWTGDWNEVMTRFSRVLRTTLNKAKPSLTNGAGGAVIYGITIDCPNPSTQSSMTPKWKTRDGSYGAQASPRTWDRMLIKSITVPEHSSS